MLALVLRNYNTIEARSFKEWSSILDLSTRWGFVSIRELAIRCINPPNSLNRLLLGRKHGVEQWILPALLDLCQRPEPLSLEEARLMDFEDVVLLGSVRQTVRSNSLMVRGAEIRSCIRAWKRGEPWNPVSDPPACPPEDDSDMFGWGQPKFKATLPPPIEGGNTPIEATPPPFEMEPALIEEANIDWGRAIGKKKKGRKV